MGLDKNVCSVCCKWYRNKLLFRLERCILFVVNKLGLLMCSFGYFIYFLFNFLSVDVIVLFVCFLIFFKVIGFFLFFYIFLGRIWD